jgi:adenylosuccinate synthase
MVLVGRPTTERYAGELVAQEHSRSGSNMADIVNSSLYAKLQHQFHSTLRSLSRKESKENEEMSKNKMDAEYHEVEQNYNTFENALHPFRHA